MMGHGNGYGLMSVGQFPKEEHTIIDDSMVGEFLEKKDSIYIWCDADFLLWLHSLNGLCCGMFVSEIEEGHRCNIKDCDLNLITESNNVFVSAPLTNAAIFRSKTLPAFFFYLIIND